MMIQSCVSIINKTDFNGNKCGIFIQYIYHGWLSLNFHKVIDTVQLLCVLSFLLLGFQRITRYYNRYKILH